ncbi:flagellar basal body rod protein FlgC [Xinfangfangia sp. CPCC 101601]|uniref:Flagellar basal body rod protein FlgC n=1 Tax=Pseudogemmobacter lacusdianii TaxID=3069608 RepID=A0ABU0VU92_9RHOB|nr:flagellar basal body rod protein FlgC [Xinfangfangia sp. CPCC 101601]MDQ2065301.1 flagellar basal body rod protein FlgC [Xinfangfangia sp. CPCC 101601]
MADLLNSLAFAASGMEAQATRLRHVSENIANADTPGYHRKTLAFETALGSGLVIPGPVRLDQSQLPRVYAPSHPLADDAGYYDGSNVDIVIEIADAREAQRSYEANLKLFDQARQMTQSLFDLLRR